MHSASISLEIISPPSDGKLQRIIKRALDKKPPFSGVEKQSDKEFKDVLIWESLLEYKENHISDVMVLYSNDTLLCDNSLKVEFDSLFHDIVYLVNRPSKASDNAELLSVLGKILNKETKPLFASNIETRIVEILNKSNSVFYNLIWDNTFEENGKDWQIVEFDVTGFNIISRTEELVNRKIFYVVEVVFNFVADDNELARYCVDF